MSVSVTVHARSPVGHARIWWTLDAGAGDDPMAVPAYHSSTRQVRLGVGTSVYTWTESLPPSGTFQVSAWVHAATDGVYSQVAEATNNAVQIAGANVYRSFPPVRGIAINKVVPTKTHDGTRLTIDVENSTGSNQWVLVEAWSTVRHAGAGSSMIAVRAHSDETAVIEASKHDQIVLRDPVDLSLLDLLRS